MAWSPNTWKTRYTLNYKGLSYRTEWVEYPDIEALCKKIGAPPTEKKPDGREHYTLPVIHDPRTKAVVAGSVEIANYLEATYPATPTLFPEGTRALQHGFYMLVRPTILSPILNIVIAPVWQLLNPRSQEYFRETREVAFGKKLEEIASADDWAALEDGLQRVKECLDANGEGKNLLLMGDRICWADIQLASVLIWLRVAVGEESEDWKRLLGLHDGRWAQFMAQFKKYEHVDI
ncbi:glutathione S-transferase [Phanerochaete sordida]|uniref:Glutathione S-transferase n=1 Tax=Phanerochaete sordida TaxID=48140 RepID=A0A9P3GRE6_9APHY|nr:glutathione S-transferase [Phanerochaete sordida]